MVFHTFSLHVWGRLMYFLVHAVFFFFQAEDGIRDLVRSRGLGDVYKRQGDALDSLPGAGRRGVLQRQRRPAAGRHPGWGLSLIHI